MHMAGIQGWDMNSWSHSGSKSSSAPATHTVLTSIQGQLWGPLEVPSYPIVPSTVGLTGHLGSAKPGGSWSCPLLALQGPPGSLSCWTLVAVAGPDRWRQVGAGGNGLRTPPEVLQRTLLRQHPPWASPPLQVSTTTVKDLTRVLRSPSFAKAAWSSPSTFPLLCPHPSSLQTPILGTPALQTPPQQKEGISAHCGPSHRAG